MKTTKKILMYSSLATLSVCIIMLISALFGAKVFEGVLLKLLITCAVIAIAGFFSINAITITNKNKTVGYVCLGLLAILSLCLLIITWASVKWGTFNKLVFILLITTIFVNIIVTLLLKLDKSFFVLQLITYALIVALDIVIALLIWGKPVLNNPTVLKLFVAGCIAVFGLLCALVILSKKVEKDGFSKHSEDLSLLEEKVKQLELENATLKAENEKLKSENESLKNK